MNYLFSLLSLVSAGICLFMASLVFNRDRHYNLNRLYILITLSVAYMAFTEAQYVAAPDFETANFWLHVGAIWPFTGTLLFHFVLVFTGSPLLRHRFVLLFMYLLAFGASAMDLLTKQISGDAIKVPWGWSYDTSNTTLLGNIILAYFMVLIVGSLFMIVRHYQSETNPVRKRRALFIMIGLPLPILAAMLIDWILPFMQIQMPEFTYITYAIFGAGIIGYGIWRYDLFSLTPESAARDILATMQDAVLLLGPDGRLMTSNQAFLDMSGYGPDGLSSLGVDDFFAPGDAGRVRQAISRLKVHETAAAPSLEADLLSGDGRLIPVSMSFSGMKDKTGLLFGVVCVAHDISERKVHQRQLEKSLKQVREAMGGIIQVLVRVIESRDPYTASHQQRVQTLCRAIAEEMGLSAEQKDTLRMAATIHDIGKVQVPAEILNKPTRLTEFEMGFIRSHAQAGFDIVKNINFPWPISTVILQHHERNDGSGYPQGLGADDIVLEAKILAVADVVEAMASHRPYRPTLGIDMALNEITKNRGTKFDPQVVDTCLALFREKGFKLPD